MLHLVGIAFSEVGKSNDVACVVVRRPLVGHPHLNLRNLDARGDEWEFLHILVVSVAEVMSEEVVTVLVVFSGKDFVGAFSHTSLR